MDPTCGDAGFASVRVTRPFLAGFACSGVRESLIASGLANGFIWVYSEPGRGSSFKLYFPIAENAANGVAIVATAAPPHGTETVLLVEDSAAVRAAARLILNRYGYTVMEAPSGKAALAIASKTQQRIDLLLTDVVMPEMSGRELAERFYELRPSGKVLFMSGYTDDAVVRHGILTAGVNYIQKPFSGDVLAAKIRSVLDAPRTAEVQAP
jgi:two-component system cell cycle sensor histidine kinase/response regulator CckA